MREPPGVDLGWEFPCWEENLILWNVQKRKELRVLWKKSARKQNQWTLRTSNHREHSTPQHCAAVIKLGWRPRCPVGIQLQLSCLRLSVLDWGGSLSYWVPAFFSARMMKMARPQAFSFFLTGPLKGLSLSPSNPGCDLGRPAGPLLLLLWVNASS